VARLQLEAQIQYRLGNNKDAIRLYSELFQQHKVPRLAPYIVSQRGLRKLLAWRISIAIGCGCVSAAWAVLLLIGADLHGV